MFRISQTFEAIAQKSQVVEACVAVQLRRAHLGPSPAVRRSRPRLRMATGLAVSTRSVGFFRGPKERSHAVWRAHVWLGTQVPMAGNHSGVEELSAVIATAI